MSARGHPHYRQRFFSRRTFVLGATLYAGFALIVFVSGLTGCRRNSTTSGTPAAAAPVPDHSPWKSTDCLSCHEQAFKAWEKSHHALAHRPVNATADADAFQSPREISVHGVDYQLAWRDGKPAFTEKRPNAPADHYTADFALGQRLHPPGDLARRQGGRCLGGGGGLQAIFTWNGSQAEASPVSVSTVATAPQMRTSREATSNGMGMEVRKWWSTLSLSRPRMES